MPSAISSIFGTFSHDLGIDLGTANALVYARGKGIVISEPTLVALDQNTRKILAIGNEARAMLAHPPDGVIALRPLRDGAIAEMTVVKQMLKHFIERAREGSVPTSRPRVVISVPSTTSDNEKEAIRKAAVAAGAREVYTIDEPIAAGIGAGLPINKPVGSMVVDIGGGTTEVAVLSLGGIVISRSIRVGGDEIDTAIIEYARQEMNLIIGERIAEGAKIVAGSAYPLREERRVTLRGRDAANDEPVEVEVSSSELREAIRQPVNEIANVVRVAVEEAPPELARDIMEFGITLTGGGALLLGLQERLKAEARMPVQLADDPLTCVARGTGRVVESLSEFSAALKASQKSSPGA